MAGVSDLYDLASEFLEACNDALATTPGGAIDRAFVCIGEPAWDCCPQLTVRVPGTALADTLPIAQPVLQGGIRPRIGASVYLATLVATVIRCVTVPTDAKPDPNPDDLEADAVITYADAWAIWNWIRQKHADGELFSDACRELIVDPAVAVGPLGGCAGFEIQIRVQVDGYQPS